MAGLLCWVRPNWKTYTEGASRMEQKPVGVIGAMGIEVDAVLAAM